MKADFITAVLNSASEFDLDTALSHFYYFIFTEKKDFFFKFKTDEHRSYITHSSHTKSGIRLCVDPKKLYLQKCC